MLGISKLLNLGSWCLTQGCKILMLCTCCESRDSCAVTATVTANADVSGLFLLMLSIAVYSREGLQLNSAFEYT